MPGLFSAADPIWQYKFDANRSSYACASSILFDGFDILRALHPPDLAHIGWNKSNLREKDDLERLIFSDPRLQSQLTLFAAEAASDCL